MYYICLVKYEKGDKTYYPYGTLKLDGNLMVVHGYTIVDLCKRIFDGKEKRGNYIIPQSFDEFIKLLQYFYETQYLAIVNAETATNNSQFDFLSIEENAPKGRFDLEKLTYDIQRTN